MVTDRCFVDTVCWIALLNQDDRLHESADHEYKLLMKSGYHFVIVMVEHGFTEALTTNEHFQQAGFRALLREDM